MHGLRSLIIPLFTSIAMLASASANPQAATKLRTDWETSMSQWNAALQAAQTPEQRQLVISKQPDAAAQIEHMWSIIGSSLDREWTIDHAAWFIFMSTAMPTADPAVNTLRNERIESIKKAIRDHHLRSTQLPIMCMALAKLADPSSLALLETIERNHPEPSVQGVAALGTAMVLRALGDDPELLRRRLSLLRKAIIDSADIRVNETTVANIAENELYLIRYLSKGRVAPDITGMDAAGKPIQLRKLEGKVIILIFWNSSGPQSNHTIEFTRELTEKFTGKPVEILGINHDPLVTLRKLIADETITWNNISDPEYKIAREYRVASWPIAYVLDQQQKIQYVGNLGTFAELAAEALIR